MIFFLRALEATELTDLGILVFVFAVNFKKIYSQYIDRLLLRIISYRERKFVKFLMAKLYFSCFLLFFSEGILVDFAQFRIEIHSRLCSSSKYKIG